MFLNPSALYDKADLPIDKGRGLVALMPLGESHHQFLRHCDSFISYALVQAIRF